jgi:hypothetical protein
MHRSCGELTEIEALVIAPRLEQRRERCKQFVTAGMFEGVSRYLGEINDSDGDDRPGVHYVIKGRYHALLKTDLKCGLPLLIRGSTYFGMACSPMPNLDERYN